jgi:PAS domain S-box-containing protein
VFTSIASGVLTTDFEDRITLCNPAAQQILGMKADRLLGASLGELAPQLGEDLSERVREAKSADHRHIGLEVRSEPAGRGPMDLALNITPLKMADRTTRGVAIVLEDLTEKRRLQGQRRLFERMVSPAVIDQLDPDSLHLGGRRADITTLFADIRGFSLFSATNNPEVLVRVLNHYLAAAAEAVLREEGTIDKFLGDGLMAWFNAPMPQPDHTLRALRAALGIRQAVLEVQAKLPRQFHLSFGVGMHYGEAILGLVGTQNRLDYTAIGDSVNTAKRLQEHASEGQILLTQAVASRVRGQVGLLPMGRLQIKGREEPLEVFELSGPQPI